MDKVLKQRDLPSETKQVIQEANLDYQLLLDSFDGPFCVIDVTDYSVIVANAAAKMNAPNAITCHAMLRSRATPCPGPCPVREVKRTKKPVILQHIYNDEQGDTRTLELHAYPILNGEGEFSRIVKYSVDFTERKRTMALLQQSQLALHETTERYQMLIENMRESLVLVDTQGKLTFVNPRFAELIGFSIEEMIGKGISRFVPRTEIVKHQREWEKSLEGIAVRIETHILQKSGHTIPVLISTTPLFTDTGALKGVMAVLTDITMQKEYQRLQDQFIASTGHELRTPITIFAGYLDFLQKHPYLSPNQVTHIYRRMHGSINRMKGLIQNVHVLAQTTQEVFKLAIEPTSLDGIVQTLQEQCTILHPTRMFMLNFIQPRAAPHTVAIDKSRVLQAVHNLIENAVKNSSPISIIEIAVLFTQAEVTFSIQDMGVGIPMLNFIHLFQPFSHIDTEYSTQGTGLGLYIVKSIVLAHGGRIEVLSQEGHGSNFTIRIPSSIGL